MAAAGSSPTPLAVTSDPAADELLRKDPLALLIGMLLDQQIPMEWAFVGPHRLAERLASRGLGLDAGAIAAMDPDELIGAFAEKPSLHRYPKSMGARVQQLCQHLVEVYGGDAEAVWATAADGAELARRLRDLPGYGPEKAKIFLALLAKRFGVRPPGWEEHAGAFADDQFRSVADIDGPEALEKVREYKKLLKAKGKGKEG